MARAASGDGSPPPLITVLFESGDTLRALSVEPSGIGMVRITDSTSRYEFRPANRIRRVLDGTGADRTRDALDRGRVVGSSPAAFAGERFREPERHALVRYGPRSVTPSFGIIETSAFGRLNNASRDDRTIGFTVDLGWAFNVGDHDALGLTAFYGGGDGWGDLGVRARYRRWLGATSSIDLAPGVILTHEEPGTAHGKGVGIVGLVAWNYSRLGGLMAQVYSVEREDVTRYYGWFFNPTAYVQRGGRDTGVMVGIKLGGRPALYSGIAASMAAVIAAGTQTHAVYAPGLP
jgi:hypothetical protein